MHETLKGFLIEGCQSENQNKNASSVKGMDWKCQISDWVIIMFGAKFCRLFPFSHFCQFSEKKEHIWCFGQVANTKDRNQWQLYNKRVEQSRKKKEQQWNTGWVKRQKKLKDGGINGWAPQRRIQRSIWRIWQGGVILYIRLSWNCLCQSKCNLLS